MKRRLLGHALLLLATALLLGGAALLASPASAQTAPLVNIQPAGQQIDYANGEFTIRIELSGFDHHGTISYDTNRDGYPDREEPSTGLGAYELKLHFDPNVVSVKHMEAGEFLRSGGRSSSCLQRIPGPGEFAIGCVSLGGGEGPQGAGNLAVITLAPVANGLSNLGLEAGLAGPLGDSIDVSVDGGTVEVINGPAVPPTATARAGAGGTTAPGQTPGTPRPYVTLGPGPQATAAAIATATARAANGGTPGPHATGTLPAAGNDGGGGSNTSYWIIGAVAAAVALIVLLAASRFIIRGRQ